MMGLLQRGGAWHGEGQVTGMRCLAWESKGRAGESESIIEELKLFFGNML